MSPSWLFKRSTIFFASPKSHNFNVPYSFIKTLEGLRCFVKKLRGKERRKLTSDQRRLFHWSVNSTGPWRDLCRTSGWSPLAFVCHFPGVRKDRHQRNIQKLAKGDFWFRTSCRISRCACFSNCRKYEPAQQRACERRKQASSYLIEHLSLSVFLN